MTLEQMTHTCWRCRYGFFPSGNIGMVCVKKEDRKVLSDKEAKNCKLFKPSTMAVDYFQGVRMHEDQRRILTEIYKERVKNGTF